MKDNYKISDFLPYLIFGIAVVIILIILKPILGLVSILAFAYIFYLSYSEIKNKNEETIKHIENLNENFDSLTKEAIFDMPFPLVVTDEKAKILWYNTPFINLFNEKSVLDRDLENLVKDIDISNIIGRNGVNTLPIEINKRSFSVYTNIVENKSEKSVEHGHSYTCLLYTSPSPRD